MIVAVLIFLGICLLFVGLGIFLDYRDWNGGYCRKCQEKWVVARWQFLEMDSHAGRSFFCPKCGNVIWISIPLIEHK